MKCSTRWPSNGSRSAARTSMPSVSPSRWDGSSGPKRARRPASMQPCARIEADLGERLPDGYVSELCPGLAPWLQSLADRMTRGVMLFIDYGLPRRDYYSSERRDGTLICHFRHRFHDDPFTRLGLQDITAWVDFTAVAEAAQAARPGRCRLYDPGAFPDRLRHLRVHHRRRAPGYCRARQPFAPDHGADACPPKWENGSR